MTANFSAYRHCIGEWHDICCIHPELIGEGRTDMELATGNILSKGVAAHKAGQLENAAFFYNEVIQSEPEHPDANHNFGVILIETGKINQSLPFLLNALHSDGSKAQYWLSYIEALIMLGMSSEAQIVFNQAKEMGAQGPAFDELEIIINKKLINDATDLPSIDDDLIKTKVNALDSLSVSQALRSAQKMVGEGDVDEVRHICESILARFPHNKKAKGLLEQCSSVTTQKSTQILEPSNSFYQNLGDLRLKGKLLECMALLTKELDVFPHCHVLYSMKGVIEGDLGQWDDAIASYNKAIKIEPDFAEGYNNLGSAFQCSGDVQAAIPYFEKAIKIKPNYDEPHFNKGTGLMILGQVDNAADYFMKAIKLNPNHYNSFNALGEIAREKGNLDEAVNKFKKAIKIKPDFAGAYNNMGATFMAQGKLDEADKAIKVAIKIAPTMSEAYNNLGINKQIKGDLRNSVYYYKKGLELKKESNEMWGNIIFALRALKRTDEQFYNIAMNFDNQDTSELVQINKGIIDYDLNFGCIGAEKSLNDAISLMSSAKDRVIFNPNNDNRATEPFLDDTIVALVHFGRSGTGLLHSLIDNHPEVATLPSIYFMEYFSLSTWRKIIAGGWDQMPDRFITLYEVLFNAQASTPVGTRGNKSISSIGIKEGMANVGNTKREVLCLDKTIFRNELRQLMQFCDRLDALAFFKMVHVAYAKAIGDDKKKNVLFYHIHNPSSGAKINFRSLAPKTKWLMMVRDPIQSCESWIEKSFVKNDYTNVSAQISTMLLDIDDVCHAQDRSIALRLEDLKTYPKKAIPALCDWLGIEEQDSLYEMTAQGKKWWGDPSSPNYGKEGMDPFGQSVIKRKVGSVLSDQDQFILRTLFYPFSVLFGYAKENSEQFKMDLKAVQPMLEGLFDFEKSIIMATHQDTKNFSKSVSYLNLRTTLIQRWEVLNEFGTYPNMIKRLNIE